MSCSNISVSVSPASCNVSGNHVVHIYNPETIQAVEYSQYRISTDSYLGYINDIVPGDVINYSAFYNYMIAIVGVK